MSGCCNSIQRCSDWRLHRRHISSGSGEFPARKSGADSGKFQCTRARRPRVSGGRLSCLGLVLLSVKEGFHHCPDTVTVKVVLSVRWRLVHGPARHPRSSPARRENMVSRGFASPWHAEPGTLGFSRVTAIRSRASVFSGSSLASEVMDEHLSGIVP